MSVAALLSISLLIFGCFGYYLLERWPLVDCFYAAAGVTTTVGIFVTPATSAGAFFTSLLNIASLGVSAAWLNEIADMRTAFVARTILFGSSSSTSPRPTLALATAALIPWGLASVVLALVEGWPLPTSIFLTLCCATGLGMSSVSPKTSTGKLTLAFYVVYNMGTVLAVCANVGHALHEKATRLTIIQDLLKIGRTTLRAGAGAGVGAYGGGGRRAVLARTRMNE